MIRAQKIGTWVGIAGTVLGCTAWMVFLGVALKDPVLITAPVVITLLCIMTGFLSFKVCPHRLAGILGLMGLWLMMLNGMVINAYYEKIPEMIGGTTTGKTPAGLFQANLFIVVFAMMSSGAVLYELFRKK